MNALITNPSGGIRRTWRIPRLLLEDQIALAGLSWAGLLVATIAVVTGIHITRDVDVNSGWDIASGVVSWYGAFIGGYVMHTVLPLHIANGRTRRDFGIEALVFIGVFTTVVALLTTLGFAIEQGVYAIGDWPQHGPDDHLFTSYTAYGTIFVEYWLTVLVWTVAGGLVGAAIYRYPEGGWFSLVPALALVSLAGIGSEPRFGPLAFIMEWLNVGEGRSMALAFTLSLACLLAGLAMIWPIVRDTPMRNK